MTGAKFLIGFGDLVLVTGSNGFIGSKVVETLISYGFNKVRCFARPSSDLRSLRKGLSLYINNRVEIIQGNLLSRDDCDRAVGGVSLIYHLAAGKGEKSYASAYLNSVVTTRNLLDAAVKTKSLRRFVNVSSLTVYSNTKIRSGGLLDERTAIEDPPQRRGEAYTYAKVRQDELVSEYSQRYGIPCVFMRPGAVYGPGNKPLTGRVGIDTFGVFLHLGGSNRIPLTYVDNCAEGIVLGGITRGVDGEVFNIVDDNLPKSRDFLRMYKRNVRHFTSIYVPKPVSYFLCCLWEKYSDWSRGQLPPVFNRNRWSADWKGNTYSNEKLKNLLDWRPRVGFEDAARRYFAFCREEEESA